MPKSKAAKAVAGVGLAATGMKIKKKNFYQSDGEQDKFLRSVGVTKERKDLTGHSGGIAETRARWKRAHNKGKANTDAEVIEFNRGKAVTRGSAKKFHDNIQNRLAKDKAADAAYKKHSAAGGGGQAAFEKEFKDHEWGRKGRRRHDRTIHGNRIRRRATEGTKGQQEREQDRQSSAKMKRLQGISDKNSSKYKQLMHEWSVAHSGTHDVKTGKRKQTK